MDLATGFNHTNTAEDQQEEQRAVPRYTSLIRAAKIVSAQGEFVCVIRDVSQEGVKLRTFHDLPMCKQIALELQNGECFELEKVSEDGREANFRFDGSVAVEQLIHESWAFPKRQLRLNLAMPLVLTTLTARHEAIAENLSQQGARVDCEAQFAIDQTVRIQGEQLPEIRAKVRWRRDHSYGLVFDNTFTLRDFSLLAATVQCPTLVLAEDRTAS
ncbi:PilZ domain-containing protein [Qipengyuania marisflavi]|uniref:PilZ domain-containing protein n=1 Tax=Qipengyuania marisflavi TaxID=2486356 RepID=A0A5S3P5I9_9SPHN|nr:PilZ domain-containing protein [Qipengyuania marisflavi]TMM48302.1 PilZ domain-containing protein [Qipengyuania marisflavi]